MCEKTTHSLRLILVSFILICIGLPLIFSQANQLTRGAYICAFLANMTSASLYYFYKTTNHSSPNLKNPSTSPSTFFSFVNISFVSFLIFIPFYIIQNLVSLSYYSTNFLMEYYNHVFDYTLSPFSNPQVVSYFLLASLFNFASYFFSLKTSISTTLNNVSLHSVLNNVRRILIVTCSTFILAEFVQPIQWLGMKFVYGGFLFYSIDVIFNSSLSSSSLPSSIVLILNEARRLFKICLVIAISFAVLMSCYSHPRRYLPYEYDSHSEFVSPRLECINKIQNEIETIIRPLIPKQGRFFLFDYPTHRDLDDSILWFGEELLLRDLGAPVQNRLSFYHDKTGEFLRYEIKSKDTILLHGHDASRSYIRNQDHAYVRNTVLQYFSNQKLIFFPKDQDKYSNHSILALGKSFFSTIHDLTIMTKNENSYEFLKKTFEQNKIVIVPDLAFMVGDMQPVLAPRVDILVLRRTQGFEISEWSRVISRKLQAHRFFSYLIRDWDYYPSVPYDDLFELASRRVDLANQVLSLGRVIITDRLHASILCMMMAKPHVIIDVNNNYNIRSVRERAFQGKSECTDINLRGFYVESIEKGVEKALWILENIEKINKIPKY